MALTLPLENNVRPPKGPVEDASSWLVLSLLVSAPRIVQVEIGLAALAGTIAAGGGGRLVKHEGPAVRLKSWSMIRTTPRRDQHVA